MRRLNCCAASEPLDPDQSRLLTDEMLKRLPQVPAGLRELVMRGAEGNPFYMEELVKMLVDEGVIDTAGEHWHVRPDKLLAAHGWRIASRA